MPRVDDFQNALAIARNKLPAFDPIDLCRNSEAELVSRDSGKIITLPFFTNKIEIAYPEGGIVYEGDKRAPSLQEQGLALHYLLRTTNIPLTGTLITFREIPSGEFYYQPFLNRAILPLVNTFGADHEAFTRAGLKLGGIKTDMGDVSMTFYPFPKTPVTLILWKGDNEFSPEGSILFDSTIRFFLEAEDIAFLSSITVYKLMALSHAS